MCPASIAYGWELYGSINNGGNTATGATYTATTSGPAGIIRGGKSTGYEFGITHSF